VKLNNFLPQYPDDEYVMIPNKLKRRKFALPKIRLLNRGDFLVDNVEDIDKDLEWLYLMLQLREKDLVPNKVHMHE
jgi:hypothetical protein